MKKLLSNNYVKLNILLFLYSFSSVLSKLASNYNFLSFNYCLCYFFIIALLGIYAIFWQKIIKELPLINAYSNKAITIVWGLIWGMLFFNETLTIFKIIGCMLVISGIVLFAFSKNDGERYE